MQYDRHVPGVFDQPPSIVDELPAIERAVFILHAVDGKDYEEIARHLPSKEATDASVGAGVGRMVGGGAAGAAIGGILGGLLGND